MCLNCPDWVADCREPGCRSLGSTMMVPQQFYVGMEYCTHLAEKYGHPVAVQPDRYEKENQ